VHALNAGDAKLQWQESVMPHELVRVIGVAPAIGFKEVSRDVLEG
jgi:hypothetical protein